MKKLTVLALLFLVIAIPSAANAAQIAYLGDLSIVSWMENDTVFVAIGNESRSRTSVTISTDTWDSWRRPVFNDRTVAVPGRSLLVESFRVTGLRRDQSIRILATERYRSVNVPLQKADLMKPAGYVIPANSFWEVTMDLSFLVHGEDRVRLVIDDFYQATGANGRGRIQVQTFKGGLEYYPSSNSIEYVSPYMVLSMKSPNVRLGAMTFDVTKVIDGYRGYRESIPGPTVLVYGRDMRYIDNAGYSGSGSSSMITL